MPEDLTSSLSIAFALDTFVSDPLAAAFVTSAVESFDLSSSSEDLFSVESSIPVDVLEAFVAFNS